MGRWVGHVWEEVWEQVWDAGGEENGEVVARTEGKAGSVGSWFLVLEDSTAQGQL
jgi:hypothetical protein